MIPIPDISQTYPKKGLKLDTRFIPGEGNARDLSVDSNTGTLVSGRAVSFDGATDYIDCGAGVDPTASGSSLVAWVKAGTVGSGGLSSILESCGGGNSRFAIGLSESESKFYVTRFWGGSYGGHMSTAVSASTWYHVVGTVSADGNTIALYVNGVSMTESYGSNKSASGSAVTTIGRLASTATYYFHGSIAGCKVFNTPLTAAQALELYNNPEQILPAGVSASALKRYYPLCDYVSIGDDSLNGLYVMDLGADKVNGKCYMTDTTVSGGGMDLAESPSCPQLGLMPSTSRYLAQVDDFYTITQDSDINALFASGGSISFWVCPFSTGEGGFGRIIDTTNVGYTFLLISESGGSCKMYLSHFFDGADGVWQTTNTVLTIGAWSHVVLTYNSSDVANNPVIYVNGSSKAITESTTPTGTTEPDNGNKLIGDNGADRAFDGYISECGMWKTVLDADAVTAIYNSGVQGFDLLSDSGNYDVSSSLKGWWKFNNAFTVQDLTSYNNDAVASGSPVLSTIPEGTTPGTTLFGNTEEKRADNAVINLNGKEYVTIPHDVNLNPDVSEGYTVSVWVKYRNLGNGASTPIFDKDTGNDRWHLRIRDDASDIYQLNFGDGSGSTDVDGNAIADNDWHHIVYTLASDGSDWTTGTYYRDGASVSTTDISARGADTPGTAALTIGAISTTPSLDGAIAYPKIYARVLGANEIKLLYSSGLRVVGGL